MLFRLPDGTILATPTGSSFGQLDPENLSLFTTEGELLSGKKPSKEATFHVALFRANMECNAVVHLHSA